MLARDLIQLAFVLVILAALTPAIGRYLRAVFERAPSGAELSCYRLLGLEPDEEHSWKGYAIRLIVFSAASVVFCYVITRLQHRLPLNPRGAGPLAPHLAMNVAAGFITGTAWTSYTGETDVSWFTQMVALVYQNFISAATSLCAAVALIRGLARRESRWVGNFWIDLVRANLFVLLPACLVFALIFVSQGVIQNFAAPLEITTLEGARQVLALGPVASQEAIKILGSNGEGVFNASSAHPFENPTALANLAQLFAMLLLPSGLVYQFGLAVGNRRHAWSVWAAMAILLVVGAAACGWCERSGNPLLARAGASSAANYEGKEARFGTFGSALYATVTTDTSTGSVNAMLDSFTPLGGLVALVNMKLGEVIFGGVGSGLYGMIGFIIVTVFIAGLMVGRTPEYLGKKLEGREVKYVMLATIAFPFVVLVFSAWASVSPTALSTLGNPSNHGFTELLYAYVSGGANNGSSFAGLSTNTPFWNLTLSFVMLFGRFFTMVPMLAVAGSMAAKRTRPVGAGTFPTEGATFVGLLVAVLLIVGALTFFPSLALGPLAEHFDMRRGGL